MQRPYNSARTRALFHKNGGKLGLLVLGIAVAAAGVSCRKAATAPGDREAVRPVAEVIAEADQLYAGRTNLVKVRQGVVTLRQAQVEDQSNYDLAWRLAKFNYYLGAHTPDSTEQDKSFHDGIEAGLLAVKLQNNKPDG